MIINLEEGRFGNEDKILSFTTTNREGKPMVNEPLSCFRIGLMVNQLAFNECKTKNGKYLDIIKRNGEYERIKENVSCENPIGKLFFREAINEAMNMAIIGINWAEENNYPYVVAWANKYYLRIENIEENLKRTFQKGLHQFGGMNNESI